MGSLDDIAGGRCRFGLRLFRRLLFFNLKSAIVDLFACFLVILGVIHYVCYVAADGEGLLVVAWGIEADSDWGSLPDWGGTGRVWRGVVGHCACERLLQHRLSAI